jgi:hypothetical protein
VLDNDRDAEQDPITAILEKAPEHGTLLLLADGRFFYEPDPGFTGQDGYRYRVRDASGAESEPVVATLEVERTDTISLFLWRHGLVWSAAGPLAEGDLAIRFGARGGLRRVVGQGRVRDRDTAFALDVRRLFFAPLFWGRFEILDPSLPSGTRVGGGGFAHLERDGDDGVRGWMLALAARPPFFLYAEIRDRR